MEKKRHIYYQEATVEISVMREEDLENFILRGAIRVKSKNLKTTVNILIEFQYIDCGRVFKKNND